MSEPAFDPLEVLRLLQDRGVRYVLIGGFAAELLGSAIVSGDIDICYDRSRENLERLVDVLKAVDARLRVARVDEDLPFILDARTLAAGDSFTFRTSAGDVDILATPSGTRGYPDLAPAAQQLDVGEGLLVTVAALDDLIRMKRASDRVKDRVHLLHLEALKEVLEEDGV